MTATTDVLRRDFDLLRSHGLHPYPVGKDKLPVGRWAEFVATAPEDADRDRWVADLRVRGWAVLCGNREVKAFTIDVEAAGMAHAEVTAVLEALPATCLRKSPSGGMHAVVVVTDGDPVPTQVLARRDGVLLAEVRGVSKSEGRAGAYAMVTGPGRGDLPEDFAPARLTRGEVDALLDRIRALHAPTEREQKVRANKARTGGTGTGGGTGAVITDAILTGELTWPQVLEPGWTEVDHDGDRIHLLRPGSPKSGQSGNAEGPVLVVHSGEVDWADPPEAFNPPQALAASCFDGDFAAAMATVEKAAQGLVEDGVAPTAWPMSSWPAEVLKRVHDRRRADREEWRRQEDRKVSDWMDQAQSDESTTDEVVDEDPFDGAVRRKAAELRVLRLARERDQAAAAAEQAAGWQPPEDLTADDLLAEPDEDESYRVDGLWPAGGNVTLSAGAKTGKTTLNLNLVRSLVTGEPFLGRFKVTRVTGRVAILDLELSRRALRRWMRAVGIAGDQVLPIPKRGEAGWVAAAVLDPVTRARFAAWLRERDVEVLILDPLAVLLAGAGVDENSNSDVGRVLRNGIAALQAEAGISEVLLVHHAGHASERSRGASALLDWPDALWTYVKDGGDPDSDDTIAGVLDQQPRFLTVVGRDCDLPETRVDFDPATLRLTVADDAGSRAQARRRGREAAKDVELLKALRGLGGKAESYTAWYNAVGGKRGLFNASRDRLVASGEVTAHPVLDDPRGRTEYLLRGAFRPAENEDQGPPGTTVPQTLGPRCEMTVPPGTSARSRERSPVPEGIDNTPTLPQQKGERSPAPAAGPRCARCQTPMKVSRYGPDGRPLCANCEREGAPR